MDKMLLQYVFPEFNSPHGHMRARVSDDYENDNYEIYKLLSDDYENDNYDIIIIYKYTI